MNRCFTFKNISFHKEPNTWIKLSWRIKVQNVSEISIPFSIINSRPSQESHCSQMKPTASLLLQPLFLRKYLCSRQTPPVWVTITCLNLEFPCLSLTTQGQVCFIWGWGNTVVIQKMKIEEQIPDLTHCCCGKTIPPSHWNYHWKESQLHSNEVAPKMQ